MSQPIMHVASPQDRQQPLCGAGDGSSIPFLKARLERQRQQLGRTVSCLPCLDSFRRLEERA